MLRLAERGRMVQARSPPSRDGGNCDISGTSVRASYLRIIACHLRTIACDILPASNGVGWSYGSHGWLQV